MRVPRARGPGRDRVVASRRRDRSPRRRLGYTDDCLALLRRLRVAWKGPPTFVSIERGIERHVGLGATSMTMLALARAYAELCDVRVSIDELARLTGRGGTSGASVNLFETGGFVVDGGRKRGDDAADAHLLPSRFARVTLRRPPVLIRRDFPRWPVLLMRGAGRGLEGPEELEWFRSIVPTPIEEARRASHLVLMGLAPAVADADYEGFCTAVNAITRTGYYKRKQLELQVAEVRALALDAPHRDDVHASGLSSMGPTCFAFVEESAALEAWLMELRDCGVIESYHFTRASNHGAAVEHISPSDVRPPLPLPPTAKERHARSAGNFRQDLDRRIR